ncbi:site-2 protease family protein [Desulfohalovibrio reitneri]|uniref:site-2 protease family protein n=1 Tax=Desulfohalovibrio reitneri TaxID=1307759 RepID=UPI0004A6E1C9|nr:site-2 protease family protein [Desulfohalovibrio reitneri]
MLEFDLARTLQKLALILPGFLLAITFHEAAHGYVAYRLGDPTAKFAGRLTLNPLKHLDVVGTLVLVITQLIGWAKPVPVNPRFFKDPRKGMMLVGLAGPMTNFLLAAVLSQLFAVLASLQVADPTMRSILVPLAGICQWGMLINLVLGCFNLLPIPPLDGSNVLSYFLPRQAAYQYESLGRYGFIIVILLAVTGMLGEILLPMVNFLANLLL